MISEFQEALLDTVGACPSTQIANNKYENVLENLDSGIMLFDSDGVLTFINVQMVPNCWNCRVVRWQAAT